MVSFNLQLCHVHLWISHPPSTPPTPWQLLGLVSGEPRQQIVTWRGGKGASQNGETHQTHSNPIKNCFNSSRKLMGSYWLILESKTTVQLLLSPLIVETSPNHSTWSGSLAQLTGSLWSFQPAKSEYWSAAMYVDSVRRDSDPEWGTVEVLLKTQRISLLVVKFI